MKKTPLIVALIAFAVAGCSPDSNTEGTENKPSETQQEAKKTPSQSPQDVAKAFYENYIVKRDIGAAYDYFSEKDKKIKTKDQYVNDKTTMWEDAFKSFNKFEIKSSEISADKATIKADITTVDVAKLFEEAIGGESLLSLASMSKEEAEKVAEKNLAKYKDGTTPPPMTTESQTIELIKENNEWKILVGWAAEEANKASANPVLEMGGTGTIMSHPEKGNVSLKANSVKFTTAKADPGMALCIVNITVTNQMKDQYTENIMSTLATGSVYAQGGNKYDRHFDTYAPELFKSIDELTLSPLNPGKSITGDIVFQVDKAAKGLTLKLDAGFSPIPDTYDHASDKSLSFKLGDVAL
ncbi:MAG: DUF4352 domain-containing protein [Candidatus Sericytochromatia bacterium]|nr:DUF4352 domain-containing protein [Candidatus Sericytochromatia bacterium]